jgi:hypothetical protein
MTVRTAAAARAAVLAAVWLAGAAAAAASSATVAPSADYALAADLGYAVRARAGRSLLQACTPGCNTTNGAVCTNNICSAWLGRAWTMTSCCMGRGFAGGRLGLIGWSSRVDQSAL